MGRYISTTGTAGVVTKLVNTTYQAVVNDRILANSSVATFIDATSNFGTNNVTVARNGSLIQGAADDLTLDLNGAIMTLIYTGPTYGWIVGAV
jgi:hypothetical protein